MSVGVRARHRRSASVAASRSAELTGSCGRPAAVELSGDSRFNTPTRWPGRGGRADEAGVRVGELPAGTATSVTHMGPYYPRHTWAALTK